ncbi:hypothetical protein HK098_004249 [Nowakowskiella sp. JEL0407]|nr:hypothetical protein HK098_004249 [Nowakowskiella sp. JEL0407]
MDSKIFEDVFEVQDVEGTDGGTKKFDRVTRIKATSDSIDTEVTLDINSEIYPMSIGEKVTIVLSRTLSLDGADTKVSWREFGSQKKTLADAFEYVMYGKVFKYEDVSGAKA